MFRRPLALGFVFSALAAVPAAAQSGFGPLDPSQPSGITVPQIIQRMGEREASFAAARENYGFRQEVTINTISDENGRPDGEYHDVENISFDTKGGRMEQVLFAPQNTLQRVQLSPSDIEDIQHRLPFILTTPQLPDYNLTYLGKQRVDELNTYVFDVAPKQIVKGHRYFQGKVWVDQQDLQIVVVNGLNVPQITKPGHEDLSPPFTTYYEQIDGKYWFPTYTKAEGTLHFAAGDGAASQDVHMRSVVKYTEYKRYRASVTIKYNGEEIQSEPEKKQDKPKEAPKP